MYTLLTHSQEDQCVDASIPSNFIPLPPAPSAMSSGSVSLFHLCKHVNSAVPNGCTTRHTIHQESEGVLLKASVCSPAKACPKRLTRISIGRPTLSFKLVVKQLSRQRDCHYLAFTNPGSSESPSTRAKLSIYELCELRWCVN